MSNTNHQIPEWRTLDEVLSDYRLAFILDSDAVERLELPSFCIYVQKYGKAFRVWLNSTNLESLLLVREQYTFGRQDLVRLFDPVNGVPIAWPSKPYPQASKFAEQANFIRRAQAQKWAAESKAQDLRNLETQKQEVDRKIARIQKFMATKQESMKALRIQSAQIQAMIDNLRAEEV